MGAILDRVAVGLTRPINPYAQIIPGIFTAIWGIWLLIPDFSVFKSAPLFVKMAEFAPEWAWGAWAFLCGIFMIAGVLKGLYKFLAKTLAFSIWHWGTVSIMMWWGDWQNTGGITYTFVTILCAYSFLNIRINYVKHGEFIPHFYVN